MLKIPGEVGAVERSSVFELATQDEIIVFTSDFEWGWLFISNNAEVFMNGVTISPPFNCLIPIPQTCEVRSGSSGNSGTYVIFGTGR